MAEDHTYPQSGDADFAENFGQMIGSDNATSYVDRGMTFSVNEAGPDVDITTGVAFVQTDETLSNSETRLNVGYVLQLSSANKALTDSDVNYVYIDPQLSTDDSPQFAVETNTSNAGANYLRIGTIDMTGSNPDTTVENRAPSVSARSVTVTTGDIALNGSTPVISGVDQIDNNGSTIVVSDATQFNASATFDSGLTALNVAFTDENNDGDNWTVSESSSTGGLRFSAGGLDRQEFTDSGDVNIEGTISENASL